MNKTDRHGASPTADAQRLTDPSEVSRRTRRQTRLDKKRRPPCGARDCRHRIERHGRTRQDETLLIKLHTPIQPLGVGSAPMKRNTAC